MLEQLLQLVRWVDVLDIFIVTVVLSFFLSWMKQKAHWAVLAALLLFSLLYFLARQLEMFLTSQLFQVGLTGILVLLALIFQDDIRRGFDLIANWGVFAFRRPAVSDESVEVLVETVTRLSEKCIGALIVLEGQEPLDMHIRGGTAVGGALSMPLLYSLFDPHTPSHDGAVIVHRDRVEKFGAHLPLSKSLSQLRGKGTRHAAALGLAEACDALVLVVSEERGTISVAEQGKLRELTPLEVKGRLERFCHREAGAVARPSRWQWLKGGWGVRAVALTMACLLWLAFAYQPETIQRTFVVGIEFRNLPETWRLENQEPKEVEITLSGAAQRFQLMDEGNLRVAVDVSGMKQGFQEIALTEESVVRLPKGLHVTRIDPNFVQFYMYPVIERTVPIEVPIAGAPPEGFKVAQAAAQPAEVKLILRAGQQQALAYVPTEPIDVRNLKKTTTVRARLLLPAHASLAELSSPTVAVTVVIEPVPVTPKPPPEEAPPEKQED